MSVTILNRARGIPASTFSLVLPSLSVKAKASSTKVNRTAVITQSITGKLRNAVMNATFQIWPPNKTAHSCQGTSAANIAITRLKGFNQTIKFFILYLLGTLARAGYQRMISNQGLLYLELCTTCKRT